MALGSSSQGAHSLLGSNGDGYKEAHRKSEAAVHAVVDSREKNGVCVTLTVESVYSKLSLYRSSKRLREGKRVIQGCTGMWRHSQA